MPDGCELVDWKAACQDQTDLLNAAQGQVRILEKRLEDKDRAHQEQTRKLEEEIRSQHALIEREAAGQGMVPQHVYDAVAAKLEKVTAKLQTTQAYAERQRKLNTRWRAAAAEAMLALGPLRDLLLETLPPAPPAKVVECAPEVLPAVVQP